MKKIFYILALGLACIGCSKKADNERLVEWSFEATYTKASIGLADGAFAWTPGDEVAIWNSTAGSFVNFSTRTGSGKFSALAPESASFSGTAMYSR